MSKTSPLLCIIHLKVEEFKKSQEVWRKVEEEKVRLENLEIAKFSQSKEKWKEEVKCLIYLNFNVPKNSSQVEREQKKRREVKNEAVIRLAGEIRHREQVIFSIQIFLLSKRPSRLLLKERRFYWSCTREGKQRRRRSRSSVKWRTTLNEG